MSQAPANTKGDPKTDSITELELWLVVDVSGSLRVSGLHEPLERSLTYLKAALSDWTFKRGNRLLLRSLHFSQDAKWEDNEILPGPLQPVSLQPAGLTNASRMFRLLCDQLKGIKRGLAYVPPVIVLISDGLPTDEYAAEMTEFLKLADRVDAMRVCIATGPDASVPFCRAFTHGMPFDPLIAPTVPQIESALHVITGTCLAILQSSQGVPVAIPLPRSTALPALMTTVSEPGEEGEGVILSASIPLSSKRYASIVALHCSAPPELPIDLRQSLELAVEAAGKQTHSAEDMVDRVAEHLLADVRQSKAEGLKLLALSLSTPESSAVLVHQELLTGCVPPLAESPGAWLESAVGSELKKRLLPEGISMVVSSPEFCESFGYGEQADALAAELTAIFRDRGGAFVTNSRPAWAARARAMTGRPPFALAVLYGD